MPEGPHDTANIRAASGGSSRSYIAEKWAVRRLTPRECERLQGFPDDYTRISGLEGWRDVGDDEDRAELAAARRAQVCPRAVRGARGRVQGTTSKRTMRSVWLSTASAVKYRSKGSFLSHFFSWSS